MERIATSVDYNYYIAYTQRLQELLSGVRAAIQQDVTPGIGALRRCESHLLDAISSVQPHTRKPRVICECCHGTGHIPNT